MQPHDFWQIIERSRHSDSKKHRSRLRALLRGQTDDEIACFAALLGKSLDEVDTPALAAAAEIVLGGLTDDSYEHFRLWLVSRGLQTTLRVLSDPNVLAGLIGDDPDNASFEEFAFPPTDLLEKRMKQDEVCDLVERTRAGLGKHCVIDKSARTGFAKRSSDMTLLRDRIEGDQELQARRKANADEAQQWLDDTRIHVSITGIRVGQRVKHAHFGGGTLLSAMRFDTIEQGFVSFDDGEKRGLLICRFDANGIQTAFLQPE